MINPPKWCSKAIPTVRGWKHHVRKEILKPQRFTQEQCNEYMIANGMMESPEVIIEVPQVEAPAMLNEAPVGGDLDGMTKVQLEALGRQNGIELDRRKGKKTLIDTLKNIVN
jgi:hypothetical protein